MCRTIAGIEDGWDTATEQFRMVTDSFEAGNPRIDSLAAESYGWLGFIAENNPSDDQSYCDARDLYELAESTHTDAERREVLVERLDSVERVIADRRVTCA